jgi:hypothetical protein
VGSKGMLMTHRNKGFFSTKFEKPSPKASPNEKHSPEDGETWSKEAAYHGLHGGINLTGMGHQLAKR